MVQLALPLALPPDLALRARLAEALYCETLRARLAASVCRGYQLGTDPRREYCRSGRCLQGVAVLLAAGDLRRVRCPTCAGHGWVPADRQADSATTGGGLGP